MSDAALSRIALGVSFAAAVFAGLQSWYSFRSHNANVAASLNSQLAGRCADFFDAAVRYVIVADQQNPTGFASLQAKSAAIRYLAFSIEAEKFDHGVFPAFTVTELTNQRNLAISAPTKSLVAATRTLAEEVREACSLGYSEVRRL